MPASEPERAISQSQISGSKIIKFGQISFINALPIVLPVMSGAVNCEFRTQLGSPAELNLKLKKGELELGAMSSYFFLEQGNFEIFPEISISGNGQVGSVLLFCKGSPSDLHQKIVDVPDSSASSIKLLQVLLKEEFDAEPILRTTDLKDPELPDSEAVLLIGDKALHHDQELSSRHSRFDLAEWWFRLFGLPFVFGVWAARKTWVEKNFQVFRNISESLIEARSLGLGNMLSEVIAEASRRTGLTGDRLNCYYLKELDFSLKNEHADALNLFAELCRKHALLS